MAPFSFTSANATVTLSSVTIDGNGNATIAWSRCLNGTARSGTVTNLIPAGLLVPNTSVIWGEATYSYRPTVGWGLVGTVPMSRPDLSAAPPVDQRHPHLMRRAGLQHAAHSGNTVVDLIFSMAKREVTFLSGTAAIIFL